MRAEVYYEKSYTIIQFSVVDPDQNPHSFLSSGSGYRRAKMTHKNEESSGFVEVLDVFF
jgi:hypothetical protein